MNNDRLKAIKARLSELIILDKSKRLLSWILIHVWRLVKILWCHFISIATLITLVILIYSTWWGPSVKTADEQLRATKTELAKNLDPLIEYNYTQDRFVVNSSPDTIIKSIDWISVPENTKINTYSKDLTIAQLKDSLLYEINADKKASIVWNFINCYLLGSEFYRGIPMITAIQFRRRGSLDTFTQIDLFRIKGNKREGLWIDVEKSAASTEEINKFKKEAEVDYGIYRKFLLDYNIEGACPVAFGPVSDDFFGSTQ